MSRLDTPLDGTIGLPLSQTAHIEGRPVNAESSLYDPIEAVHQILFVVWVGWAGNNEPVYTILKSANRNSLVR